MAPPPSILVLGAGELGLAVLHSLAHHPSRGRTQLAVLLRPATLTSPDPAKQALISQLRSWSIDLVPADVALDPESSLTNTFRPFHTLISCTGMYAPPETQLRIVRAVLAAAIPRFFPWQFGIDYDAIGRASAQDLFDAQLDVRDMLRAQSRTRWVIVSTGLFISFLFEPAFGIVDAGRETVTGLGAWENALTVTGPEDIGTVTAELALGKGEVEGVVYVAGDTVTMEEVAGVVDRVTGRKARRVLKTAGDLKRELEKDSGNSMLKYQVVWAEGKGVAWSKEESFNGIHGIATQTVYEWAQAHLV